MTSARDQVIRLLTDKVKTSPSLTLEIADTLAAEDCLRADLPEIWEGSTGEAAISGDGFYLEISGNEAIINDTIAFDQEHLKDLALALLAAAERMEKNA